MTTTMMRTTTLPSIAINCNGEMAIARCSGVSHRRRSCLRILSADSWSCGWSEEGGGGLAAGQRRQSWSNSIGDNRLLKIRSMSWMSCVLCLRPLVHLSVCRLAVCFWFEFKFKFVTFDIVLVPNRKFMSKATYEFLKWHNSSFFSLVDGWLLITPNRAVSSISYYRRVIFSGANSRLQVCVLQQVCECMTVHNLWMVDVA